MKKENLFVILTGVVIGIAALVLTALGNPANMGFCIACFLRDIAGSLKLHQAGVVQYFRPEIVGIVVGACLMALIGKKSTGMGTFVSTSLFASGIWCNAIGVVSHQPQFGGERPNDPLRPADPFCHFYQCSDGKWIGVFDNEYRRELPKFANLFGMPEIADDPRAASLEALHETDFVVEIVTRLNAIFKTKTVAEWEAFLSENNVSCERMRTIRDVSTDEQAIANGYIQKVTFKDDLEVMMPCPPMQFTEYAMRPYTSAGRLGADTDSIFHDLGYTDSEIAAMKDSGAIQ